MSTAASRNALNGEPVQRVTLYDGGGGAITTLPVSNTVTKTALTAMSPSAVVITASSGLALAALTTRTGLVITNLSISQANISLAFGATTNLAVLGSGVTLVPNEKWTMTDYTYTTQAINAIATASGAALSIQQFTT